MTVDDIKREVAEIACCADDDEQAHGREDDLRNAVLKAIASGAPNAAELAQAALLTNKIDFCRWCA